MIDMKLALGAAAVVGLGLLAMTWRRLREARRRARLLAVTEEVTKTHARLLIVKQKQLLAHDGYGNYRLDRWIDHANYFIDNVIVREAQRRGLAVGPLAMGDRLRIRVTKRFLRVLHAHAEAGLPEPEPSNLRSGQDYEAVCLARLEAEGWSVATTPVTGDQGADLIAETAGRRIVIQCKFHAKPVGNRAVQEAFAAKALHAAHHAAVVSNNSFTRSACALAAANQVLLLHHDQLPDLAKLIGLEPKKRRTPGKSPRDAARK